jgi:alpha-L-rhamnosidase
MGYGDGQVTAEGFLTSFRSDAFFRKWLRDWRLLQNPATGALPNTAPFGIGGGGPAWPGTLGHYTWRHWLYYGDRRILDENADTLERYLGWLDTKCQNDVLRKYGGQWDFIGDWVPPDRGMDTKNWPSPQAAELFNNAYRIYQWDLLRRIRAAQGRDSEAAKCEARIAAIRPKVHAAFYDAAKGFYVIDEQAYYVMPLLTGVVPNDLRPAITEALTRNLTTKGHLDTGMLGTYFLMEFLRQSGRNDLAFMLMNRTAYPSWGHMLERGATTYWEQWNGYWSMIHSCFTSADNWLYQGPGGIRPDPEAPGFRRVLIEPAVVGDLTWVKASHRGPFGMVSSYWHVDGDRLVLEVTVPPSSTARVRLPTANPASVIEGDQPVTKASGISGITSEAGALVMDLASGTYVLSAVRLPSH